MNATISTFTSNLFYFLHVLHVPKFFQLYHLLPSGRSNCWKQSCMQMIPWNRLKEAGFFSNWWVRGLWRFSPLWRKGKRCKRESAHRRMSLICSLHPACCRKSEEEKGRQVLVLQPVLTSSASVNAVIHMACMRLLWKDQSASRAYTLQCYSGALLNKQQCWFHQSVKWWRPVIQTYVTFMASCKRSCNSNVTMHSTCSI